MVEKISVAISRTIKGIHIEDFITEVDNALEELRKSVKLVSSPLVYRIDLNVRTDDED